LELVKDGTGKVSLSVSIASDALPARAVVRAGLLEADTGQWQAATSVSGRPLDTPIALATIKIAPQIPLAAVPQHTVQATFGDVLLLLGYDLAGNGPLATITLYWQTLSGMPEDYTTFIHLLDSGGQIIAQADGQPQGGEYPTSVWDPGEIITDTKTIYQPETSSPGPYRLVAGVYLLATGERLSARSPAGVPSGDVFVLRECPEITACFRKP
jgi:hypothetical protein